MFRDKEIQELQNEIADLRRKESEGSRPRDNITNRIIGIEKKSDDLRNDQDAFRRELASVPGWIEAKKDELQRLRQRRSEEQEALGRLKSQAQPIADELARLPKPIAVAGPGTWQDDGLAARRSLLLERETSLRFQISRAEAELQISDLKYFQGPHSMRVLQKDLAFHIRLLVNVRKIFLGFNGGDFRFRYMIVQN